MTDHAAMVTELFPIISTPDLDRSLRFWRDGLGGRIGYEFRDPASGVVTYAGLDIGRSHIGIGVAPTPRDPRADPPVRPISLWAYVEDCDDTVERLRATGVTVVAEPADQPWGERVARVLDPDGNEVIVGSRSEMAP
jgi:lactoylglutathione lyase